jgi:predicted transcriptional regulator
LEDENGEKYNLSLQGNLSKEKIMNVIDFVQMFEKNSMDNIFEHKESDIKLGSKLWNIITENFRYHTFTSSDLLRIYKDLYYESIQLSVISIYLSRFYIKKQLSRSKNGKQWVYALVKENLNYDKQIYQKFNHSSLLPVPTVYDLHL